MLAEGGNAVDACIAAAFASWVAESPLTGPGAGGFMLVHRARDRTDAPARLLRRRARPRPRAAPRAARWRRSTSTSTATTTQVFRIGAASCAVPGRRRGPRGGAPRVRLAAVARAVRAGDRARARRRRADAAAGVPARDPRPDPAPHATRAGGSTGRAARASSPATGSSSPISRDTLERCSPSAARRPLRRRARAGDRRAPARAAAARSRCDDLAALPRHPAAAGPGARSAAHEFVSNPPPSSGGVLIGYGLALLDRARPGGAAGQRRGDRAARRGDARAGRARAAAASRATSTAAASRGGSLDARASRGASARSAPARRRRRAAPTGGTTHISVVDARRERRLADGLDRLRLGRDRPGHRHPPEQHARRVRPAPGRRRRAAGRAADEHDGAVDRAAPTAGRGSSSAAPARCACAARSCRSSSTSSATGSASRRRSTRRASTSTSRTSTARAGTTRPSSTRLEALRLRRRPLAPAQPLLRRRAAVEVARGRHARRGRRPAPRRRRGRRRVSASIVRRGRSRATPPRSSRSRAAVGGGAGGLADLATSRWRSVADERRYLRAVRSAPGRRRVRRRARRARSSAGSRSRATRIRRAAHVADLGLMVAAGAPPPRDRPRAARAGRRRGRARRGVRKLELHVFPHNEPAIALYERFGFDREGYRKRALPPRRRATSTRS